MVDTPPPDSQPDRISPTRPAAAHNTPQQRAILLGASNLTFGLAPLIETVESACGVPVDILGAIGHGRSFGMTSRVLGRSLPGIIECGLWAALEDRPPLPTFALITDIGNDIGFGSSVAAILRWLETCLQRLQPIAQRIVITRLPLASVADAPTWKFNLLSSLFFPSSHLNRQEALSKATQLDEQLLQFAKRYGAYVVQPERGWYGWDPIHVTRRSRPSAWHKYLSCWSDGRYFPPARGSFRRWCNARGARPERWQLFGFARQRTQPTKHFSNGTTLSLY